MTLRPFHLAFPVSDLRATQTFYGTVLGCAVGRRSETWIDFDFFGHQITAHLSPDECQTAQTNEVDSCVVPVRHCGVILTMAQWQTLADRVRQHQIPFVIEPYIRFKGEPGEQATMFFLDPSGNALEFKAFADDASIFATV
ncbi:MAG: VOC family protein [Cyanobacteria bacterium J06554_6]